MSGYINAPYGPPGFPHASQSRTAPSFPDRAHHGAASVVGAPSGWTPAPAPYAPAPGRPSLPFESVDDVTVAYSDYHNLPFEPAHLFPAQPRPQPQAMSRQPHLANLTSMTGLLRNAMTQGIPCSAFTQMSSDVGMSILGHTNAVAS